MFYDAKNGIWDDCRRGLPFKISLHENVILMNHKNGKKYLHFITSCTHSQLEFGEMNLWESIRLIWIGYYKNHKSPKWREKKQFCMFAHLPKDIVKHIVLFLNKNCGLYFCQVGA